MCSAVFITGYDVEFAAEHVGYFTAPYDERKKVGKPVVDQAKKTVSVTLPNGVTRTAVYTGSQGCVTYPEGSDKLSFTPEDGGGEPAVGRRAGLADGRPAAQDAVPGRARRSEDQERRRRRVLDSRRRDDGVRRHLEGPADRRALRRRHHHDHAARELVDGQERDLDDHGHADPARASTRSTSRRRSPNGRSSRTIRARRSRSRTSCGCRAASASSRRRIPTTTRRARTPITSTSTRTPAMPSSTRRRVRSSGRPTPWAATATPIRC